MALRYIFLFNLSTFRRVFVRFLTPKENRTQWKARAWKSLAVKHLIPLLPWPFAGEAPWASACLPLPLPRPLPLFPLPRNFPGDATAGRRSGGGACFPFGCFLGLLFSSVCFYDGLGAKNNTHTKKNSKGSKNAVSVVRGEMGRGGGGRGGQIGATRGWDKHRFWLLTPSASGFSKRLLDVRVLAAAGCSFPSLFTSRLSTFLGPCQFRFFHPPPVDPSLTLSLGDIKFFLLYFSFFGHRLRRQFCSWLQFFGGCAILLFFFFFCIYHHVPASPQTTSPPPMTVSFSGPAHRLRDIAYTSSAPTASFGSCLAKSFRNHTAKMHT